MRTLTLEQFVGEIPSYPDINHADTVRFFALYLHDHLGQEAFCVADIRKCYLGVHRAEPASIQSFLRAMAERNPPEVLKVRDRYKLEGRARETVRSRLVAKRASAIIVENALLELPAKLSDFHEREYLEEALTCYRNGAFRAAIVMGWNLGYARLCNWIFRHKLEEFNVQLLITYPKSEKRSVLSSADFAEFKEFNVLQVCRSAGITSVNFHKLLRAKLDARNGAAHPSSVVVSQLTAEAFIVDLIVNVVDHLR